jgi:hypothetical protein
MRLLFLPAVTAILLLADQSAWAQSSRTGCVVNPGPIKIDGITNREVRTRAGHPCRLYVYSYIGWRTHVNQVHITVQPTHGTLRAAGRTEGEGSAAYTVTYVPAPGFTGHDHFEVFYQWTSFVSPVSTLYKAEVMVTP